MGDDQFEKAILSVYRAVTELQVVFSQRKFTPDGRMVGDIGEAYAAMHFKIELDKKSRKHWDGWWVNSDGQRREVQIKTTQKDGTYLKQPPHEGDLLIFQIQQNGKIRCCYNGEIMQVWEALGKQKLDNSGAKSFGLKILEDIKSDGGVPTL